MNHRVLAERGVIAVVCAVLPAITGLSLAGTDASFLELLSRWLIWAPPAALVAGAGLYFGMRYWNLNHSRIVHGENDAELISEAAKEYARNAADPKLLEKAKAEALNQDGRTVAYYIGLRIDSMRRQKLLVASDASVAQAPLVRRAVWSLVLLVSTTIILVLLPKAWQLTEIGLGFTFLTLLAIPLWATAVRVAVLGESDAANWLFRRRDGRLIPLPGGEPKTVKLRKPKKKKAEPWHLRGGDGGLPLYRSLILCLLVIAAALYLLREYGPQPGYTDSDAQYGPTAPASEPELADAADEAVTPAAQPAPVARRSPEPRPPPRALIERERARAPPPPQEPAYWRDLPARGSLVYVDNTALAASGRTLEQLQSVLGQVRPRLESWFQERLRERPFLRGRVALNLTIQPHGWISESSVADSEVNDDLFIAGLGDRIDALNFGEGAATAIRVIYAVDFQP